MNILLLITVVTIYLTAPPRQCDDCKIIDTPYKHPSGQPIWYRNRQKGIGFLCTICYNRRYQKTYQRKDRNPKRIKKEVKI